jgi:large subunit ribosomal protein L5
MYLKEKYNKEMISSLQKKLGLKNIMEIPKLEKVVLNMGI